MERENMEYEDRNETVEGEIEFTDDVSIEIEQNHPAIEINEKLNRYVSDIERNERRLHAIKILEQTAKYALGSLRSYHLEIVPEYGDRKLKMTIIVHV